MLVVTKADCVKKTENFDDFLTVWEKLPRTEHAFLPSKQSCNPALLGALLPQCAIFGYGGKYKLNIIFVGTEMEHLSGLTTAGINYYDMIADEFKPLMHHYHQTIFGTPCGAYIGDVITTRTGTTYLFETMQFPVVDETGTVNHLLAYGFGRRPTGDLGTREVSDRRGQHIRDLHYMDLGAGAPSECIINFEAHS